MIQLPLRNRSSVSFFSFEDLKRDIITVMEIF